MGAWQHSRAFEGAPPSSSHFPLYCDLGAARGNDIVKEAVIGLGSIKKGSEQKSCALALHVLLMSRGLIFTSICCRSKHAIVCVISKAFPAH